MVDQIKQSEQRAAKITATVLIALLAGIGPQTQLVAAERPAKPATRETAIPPVPPDPAPEEVFERQARESRFVPRVNSDPVVAQDLPVVGGAWANQGPGPITQGQVEGMAAANAEVVGAVHTLVTHPTNADVIWIGGANGGVWKTSNATNASPAWTTVTDNFSSLSIGALGIDPTDANHNTLVAGSGRFSSFGGVGGPRGVVLRTTDGGTSWTAMTATNLAGKSIRGLVARGATIVVSINIADAYTCSNIGIFRSTDTGATFTRVSDASGSGLPSSAALDIAGDPTNDAVLYAALDDSTACSSPTVANGIYKSTDTGATWTRVSSAAIDTVMADDGVLNNTRLAVGASGQIFAGIMNNGQMAGLFRSGDGGTSWTQLDTPSTNEGGTPYGIQPRFKPGSQGATHFSIVADPTDSNIVYVGGDRQPGSGDAGGAFPNSIGASNYTGRLFRVNASLGTGAQSTPLTHCATATAACNNTISTTSNSAPHADSRRMAFDANGNIIQGDDGGIYRRTNPRTTGDWFSINGSLRINESHDIGYDTVSNMIVGGHQDVGTAEQSAVGGTTWRTVNQGDGGDVAIDDTSSATESRRYTSSQNLGGFARRTLDASGAVTETDYPARTVNAGGPAFVAQFVTPVEVNAIAATRILIGGGNDLYESLDRGDTLTALAFNQASVAIVYGGKSQGVDNAALIWALCTGTVALPCTATNVYVRTAGTGAPVLTAASPGASALRDITVDPTDWRKAYVINSIGQVFSTADTGASWTNITGDLANGSADLRTITFIPGVSPAIVVGGLNGVFRMATNNVNVWNRLGTGLSNAPVWDLDYDGTDDVLVAGTMGRGAWKLNAASTAALPLTAPTNVVATATGLTTVNITWTAGGGASSYRVYRTADRTTYTLVGSPTATSLSDTTAVAGTAYLYKVRSFSGTESGDSNLDLATTAFFTDDPITPQVTGVKSAHFTELLTGVNAVRVLAGQAPIAFGTAPAVGGSILAQQLLDLRGGITSARTILTVPAVSHAEGTITAGSTTVKAAQITELRDGVK